MQAVEILDIKQFMHVLLQTPFFDSYDLVSATIRTDMDYEINGKWNHSFFDEAEIDSNKLSDHTYLPWQLAKDKILMLIRGKKTPTVMKLVFKLNNNALSTMLNDSAHNNNPGDIEGVYLNILFQEQKLNITCSVSYKIFSLDKSLEQEIWNNLIESLKSNNVSSQ